MTRREYRAVLPDDALATVAFDRIEVVVDRDPAHVERVGDVFHGAAQHEGSSLVEEADGLLLVLAAEVLESAAEFAFNAFDQAIEGVVKLRELQRANNYAAPVQGDVGRVRLRRSDDAGPDGMGDRFEGGEKRFGTIGGCRHHPPRVVDPCRRMLIGREERAIGSMGGNLTSLMELFKMKITSRGSLPFV